MRGLRVLIIVLVALGLAPVTWWRVDLPPRSVMPPLAIEAVPVAPSRSGPFTLERAWELPGEEDVHAGGYSALLWRGGDRLLAASDNGRLIELEGPDLTRARQRPIFLAGTYDKVSSDVEALAGLSGAGPASSGSVWAALEGSNMIVRADAALNHSGDVRPSAMADWDYNSGPETLVRLADGRFVAVAERGRKGLHRGAIFTGDPVANPEGRGFRLQVPGGFRPVDAVAGPNGEVLVLLRKLAWTIPPGFRTAIARYDSASIRAGAIARPRDVFALPATAPSDNYEGIALRPEADRSATIWLISDDNQSAFQRSLLLRLRYRPDRRP